MVLVFRFLALAVYVAGAHVLDGLAIVALICGALVGWLAVRFYWLALPVAGLANLANMFYGNSTGTGKSVAALGNIPMELFVFVVLTGIGYGLGHWVRHVQFARAEAKMRGTENKDA